ncbi:hypothetical protein PHLCEN_2v8380 [Hermanssonia centrifuga]|uniref:Uncharacterized protein n=2 Tax=Hermanssonia centrifuga TaxID=98765 RepID=A0A1U7KZS2_9APHY|nr:hypothetical protein PHLCEN_2v8380 [Hermanssonia centrifuga]
MDDLAKGAGGGYRYIFSKAAPDIPRKITHALLLRSNGIISTAPLGWDLITVDINKGRRKSYLYILAKTVATETSSKAFLNVPSVGGYLTVRSNTPKQYVQALNVCYGDDLSDLPADCVGELNGLSADVNFQCGGKFTWPVPSYAPDAAKAATSFDVLFLNIDDPKMDDLAKGAGRIGK